MAGVKVKFFFWDVLLCNYISSTMNDTFCFVSLPVLSSSCFRMIGSTVECILMQVMDRAERGESVLRVDISEADLKGLGICMKTFITIKLIRF